MLDVFIRHDKFILHFIVVFNDNSWTRPASYFPNNSGLAFSVERKLVRWRSDVTLPPPRIIQDRAKVRGLRDFQLFHFSTQLKLLLNSKQIPTNICTVHYRSPTAVTSLIREVRRVFIVKQVALLKNYNELFNHSTLLLFNSSTQLMLLLNS